MPEFVQLDKAAAEIGKSEVTLRRLIKAGKIPFKKEKTLTGFIYMVDPAAVRAYYQIKGGGNFTEDGASAKEEDLLPLAESVSTQPKERSHVRVAVGGESGDLYEYWLKRSELYEDRYNQEVSKHAQTREELGNWRGRAEQAQSMLVKLLPSPDAPTSPAALAAKAGADGAATPEVPTSNKKEGQGMSVWTGLTIFLLSAAVIVTAGLLVYYKF